MALRLGVPLLGPFDAERLLAADVSLVEVDDLVAAGDVTLRVVAGAGRARGCRRLSDRGDGDRARGRAAGLAGADRGRRYGAGVSSFGSSSPFAESISLRASLTPWPNALPSCGSVFGPAPDEHDDQDDDEDDDDVHAADGSSGSGGRISAPGRSASGITRRSDVRVSSKLATLLSTRRGRLRGVDHVDVADRRRLALARHDPDRAVGDDALPQRRQPPERLERVGREQDDIGVRRAARRA